MDNNIGSNNLELSLQQYQMLLDSASSSGIGMTILNSDYTIAWYNDLQAKLFGALPETKGRNCYEVFWGRDSICPVCPSRVTFETGNVTVDERTNITSSDGIDRTVKLTSSPIRDASGNVTHVVEIIRDITEHNQAELKYKTLLRTAMDGFYMTDSQGCILDVNDSYCSMIGYNRNELLNMRIQDIEAIETDEIIQQRMQKIITVGWDRFETRHKCKDGRIVDIETSVNYTGVGNGTFFVFMRDITERKQAEEKLENYSKELARSNEALKSLDKIKDEFLSNVSHEFKTPLTSIKGFSEVLQDELYGPLNDQQKMATNAVIRNSDRLNRLIDSIMYLTVQKSGRDTYAIHPVKITEIIGKALIDISPQANSKNLRIKNNIPSDLPLIKGDLDKLTQVFINLLENATKFTPGGGKITVAAFEDGDNIHITVTDTGIGVSADVISNLFEKFYQVDASTTRKYGGTGIGLYISKLIVEVHKGRIWVVSEEGVGTTFHVELPK